MMFANFANASDTTKPLSEISLTDMSTVDILTPMDAAIVAAGDGRREMTKVYLNGQQIDFDAAINLMDDNIREQLHADGIGEDAIMGANQVFMDAYATAHREAFGEDFIVN